MSTAVFTESRQKFALRHNNVCSCFCAHLPPGHCSPGCGAQGTAFHQGILLQGHVQPGPYSTAVTVRHPFPISQLANCLLEAQKYTHHNKAERLYSSNLGEPFEQQGYSHQQKATPHVIDLQSYPPSRELW